MYTEDMNDSNLELIGMSKNGMSVVYDSARSHAAMHFEANPQLRSLVAEAVRGMDLDGEEVKTHIDMGRTIGVRDVVETDDTDEIVYGMRKNCEDDGLVPFTKTHEGTPCPYVALHLVPQQNGSYVLSSAWVGTFDSDDEPFPCSPDATRNSINYWNRHAFVYGSQEIVPETETTTCPW